MVKVWAFLVVCTAVAVGGCATSAQFLDSKQSMAVQTAVAVRAAIGTVRAKRASLADAVHARLLMWLHEATTVT